MEWRQKSDEEGTEKQRKKNREKNKDGGIEECTDRMGSWKVYRETLKALKKAQTKGEEVKKKEK